MHLLEFTFLIFFVSFLAGFLGSLTGLGGGVVITPVLVLLFGINLRYAIGATLVSVIATSSGAASAYVKEGFSNIRIGMFLEIATTAGAIIGAALTTRLPASPIAIVFGVVLIVSAFQSIRPKPVIAPTAEPNRLATLLKMHGKYPVGGQDVPYLVQGVPSGFSVMFGAGVLSGLLGIGSGAVKVIAMDQMMRLPFKVSTTTSNFMIGVTAAASAGVYLSRGYIDPALAMPVSLGVLVGALLGARALTGAQTKTLRLLFAVVITVMAIEMMYHGISGRM
ncbi:MAG: sulfite exporter TauE/SafE family protein [Desulfobaccales bacterium]